VFPGALPPLEHTWPLGHVPQVRMPPQPSETEPHTELVAAQVLGAPDPVQGRHVYPDSFWSAQTCVPMVQEPTPACEGAPT
jgi:hypothetical protein